MEKREQWQSKFGFILAAAGSAVGLGNIWKFPYKTGQGGGAAFVLIYILLLFIVAFSVMVVEMALGRKAQRNCIGTFRSLGGKKWSWLGFMCILCPTIIVSYYVIIGGWTVEYFVKSFTSLLPRARAGESAQMFNAFIDNPKQVILYTGIYIALTAIVVYRGIGGGIERLCKYLMPTLFIFMIIFAVRACTLPGSKEGLLFFLKPNWSLVNTKTFLDALGQAFFSMSLGMGIMITYGSYLPKNEDIPKATMQICLITIMVALLGGLMVFPATSAFGVEVSMGPSLVFVTLPSVFAQMPAGMFWAAMFFVLMFFAALTSSISLLEVFVSWMVDKGIDRRKSTLLCSLIIFALSIPSCLSLTGKRMVFWNMPFMDIMCYLTDNLLMPINSLMICIFAGYVLKKQIVDEVNNYGMLKFRSQTPWWWSVKVISPLCILAIFITNLY